jgi:quinol monooxygenase YgiN
VIALTHFHDAAPDFAERAQQALTALAARPGYLRGTLGRSTDDASAWVLLTEWENVGSYRRALSSYDVRMASGMLMGAVVNEPTAYEEVEEVRSPGDPAGH